MINKLSRVLDFILGYGNGSSSEFYGLKRWLKSNVNENSVLIDVGANIGDFSLFYLSCFKNVRKIYSFEPNPILFNNLLEDEKRVKYNFAVGSFNAETVELKIPIDSKWNGISRIGDFVEEKFSDLEYEVLSVAAVSLDEFIASESIVYVDFLKIDTEGNDFDVIKSASNALKSRTIGCIYFEFGPANVATRVFFIDIVNYLNSLNLDYDIYRFSVFGNPIRVKYSIWNEYFRGNTNYLIQFHK